MTGPATSSFPRYNRYFFPFVCPTDDLPNTRGILRLIHDETTTTTSTLQDIDHPSAPNIVAFTPQSSQIPTSPWPRAAISPPPPTIFNDIPSPTGDKPPGTSPRLSPLTLVLPSSRPALDYPRLSARTTRQIGRTTPDARRPQRHPSPSPSETTGPRGSIERIIRAIAHSAAGDARLPPAIIALTGRHDVRIAPGAFPPFPQRL